MDLCDRTTLSEQPTSAHVDVMFCQSTTCLACRSQGFTRFVKVGRAPPDAAFEKGQLSPSEDPTSASREASTNGTRWTPPHSTCHDR
mmetsp:Transcript_24406/g.58031  ORF Transcript_24406/g.58031 Transcript_24406/m.58031 type:complete len:87 (+) Transcript_24406:100-360(+)